MHLSAKGGSASGGQKTKILGIGCQGIMMPNAIQPGEYSMGSEDYEGMLYNTAQSGRLSLHALPLFQRRRFVELELQLARQRSQRQQPLGCARNHLYSFPVLPLGEVGEFCFSSWPLQPPRFLPISSIIIDREM